MLLFQVERPEDLREYITNLPLDNKCHFQFTKGISFCMCKHKCKYQGKDKYTLRMGRKRECVRDRAISLMKMLK